MHRVVIPPDTEEAEGIQSLVGTLVGLSPERGDQLTVEALPFDTSLNVELTSSRPRTERQEPGDTFSLETLKKNPALLWGSVGGAALVLLLLVFGVVRMMKRGKRAEDAEQRCPSLSRRQQFAASAFRCHRRVLPSAGDRPMPRL